MFRIALHAIIYVFIGAISGVIGILVYNAISPPNAFPMLSVLILSAFLTLLFLIPSLSYCALSTWVKKLKGFIALNVIYVLSLPIFFAVIMRVSFDWSLSDKHTSFVVFLPVLIMGVLSVIFHMITRRTTLIEYEYGGDIRQE